MKHPREEKWDKETSISNKSTAKGASLIKLANLKEHGVDSVNFSSLGALNTIPPTLIILKDALAEGFL